MRTNTKKSRKLCRECYLRRARFRFRGVVKYDRDHTLCFRCFRSQSDRMRSLLDLS
jgi:hypothetical protein